MYEDFFGLKSLPFKNTPSPEFFFSGGQYRPALASLLYGLKSRKGLLAITGPSGCGKTTLSHVILKHLPENVKMISVINLPAGPFELLKLIAVELEIPCPADSPLLLAKALKDRILSLHDRAQSVVIVLDEAQSLTQSQLDDILLLSNMETHEAKLCQILLLGRDTLTDLLNQPEHNALRQRTAMILTLKPLEQVEVSHYINFRLRQAGSSGAVFTPAALSAVFAFSGGIPRNINKLCDLTMLKAFLQNRLIVDEELVEAAALELGIDVTPLTPPLVRVNPPPRKVLSLLQADEPAGNCQEASFEPAFLGRRHLLEERRTRRAWRRPVAFVLFLILFSGALIYWRQQTHHPQISALHSKQSPDAFVQPHAVPASTDNRIKTDQQTLEAETGTMNIAVPEIIPPERIDADIPKEATEKILQPLDTPPSASEPDQEKTSSSYTVHLTTVFSKADLDAELKRFRKKGLTPYWIIMERPHKQPVYRIRTRIFAGEDEIKNMLTKMRIHDYQVFKTPDPER